MMKIIYNFSLFMSNTKNLVVKMVSRYEYCGEDMHHNQITIRSSTAEYLTFVAAAGNSKESVEVRYEDENIWITQKMLAVLYDVEIPTINYHIKKIFEDSKLAESSAIRKTRSFL